MVNNEEEKKCPLCAEEMDWTDQLFMPCKCGYQVCVWCWHHIIDMAEKNAAEGRCPACRTIYEKEKIVAEQAICERTMSKVSSRKTKPPKAKPKVIEVKKDLTNIRVMQRKMAYVIGLPLSLADEDVLQRKEYFGRYGKVTKVSLSRTAGGAIQQFINDTCSVYITYSKEEEALRCIQSVHGFVLDGRLLRASFGTAKYCHAWIKNMPCNNPACLYLHTIGADEDSFGKDEVAAVHTRSRVHQIVGATHNVMKRSGSVLPSPVDDAHISCNSFNEKSTARNNVFNAAYGSGNSSTDMPPFKDKEGPIAVAHKLTTFVDIVGRSRSAAPEKDENCPEDGRILDLCSELSSITVGSETHAEASYDVSSPFKIPSSNHVANGFMINADESLREGTFFSPFYSSHISEDSGGVMSQKERSSVSGFSVDDNPVHNQDDEASLPIRYENSISNDETSSQEMKFQNSAKSDRIYRSSQSFSNEEIVAHLRRIDDDDGNLHNDEENSVLDAVKSSIISNIMSIDFDSCEDSLHMPNGLSELLDEGGSSWSSLNSDQSGYSFAKQDDFASQMAASILPDYGDNKEQYFCKSHYPVSRAQNSTPPGFVMPSRDPPPGFSNVDRTSSLPRPSSGGRMSNAFSSTLFQPSSVRSCNSFDDVDFFDPAILPNQTNDYSNTITEARATNILDDKARFWLMMHQSTPTHLDPNFSQIFAPQITPSQQDLSFAGHHKVNDLSSRLANERQNCDPSFFSQMPKQKYTDGHASSTNSYLHSLGEVQRKGDSGLLELQRNERLGANDLNVYGDGMLSSEDVYNRIFGL